MKYLLLNQAFHPDVASTGQHLTDLARGLAGRGHEVTVVSSRRAYDNPAARFAAREDWNGIRIHRVPSTGFGKRAKWRRAADFASYIAACCARLLTMRRPDVVVALTSPPLISFIGACYARLRGSRFVYWVMDLNPDEAVAAGWLRAGSPLTRVLEAMSRYSLRRADRVIALDRFMRDRIVAKGIDPARVAVLAPWTHDEAVRFDPAGREAFRRQHGLSEKFVVMYSGNHSPCHPLDTLLEAARKLDGEGRTAFCFVGGGSEFGKVQRFTQEHGLRNITCLPYQPLHQLAGSLSAADLHVVVMGDPFVGTIHPCKIYNVLRIDSPVLYIGPEPSHITDIFGQLRDCPWWVRVRHGDAEAVARHIRRLAERAGRPAPGSLAAVADRFSAAALLPRFVELLEGGREQAAPEPALPAQQ